jgi:hypothetical protein
LIHDGLVGLSNNGFMTKNLGLPETARQVTEVDHVRKSSILRRSTRLLLKQEGPYKSSSQERACEVCYKSDYTDPFSQKVAERKNKKLQIKERTRPLDEDFALTTLAITGVKCTKQIEEEMEAAFKEVREKNQ